MVAIAEQGLVPSVQAARMTLAAAPDAMQGAVAAGLLGAGSVVLGASETAGRLFLRIEAEAAAHGGDLHAAARAVVADLRARRQIIPGYGHPEHKSADPRVAALFGVSQRVGGWQKYVELARIVEGVIPELTGKDLAMNVSGGHPGRPARGGLSGLGLEGHPDAGPCGQPDRAPQRGDGRPDRLRAVQPCRAAAAVHG